MRFKPGFYADVADLNSLFKAPACRDVTFWFEPDPGPDGVVDAADDTTPDDRRGIYYFDFRGSGRGGACGRYTDSGSPPPATNDHQWCIGNDGTYDQRVVGGSPFDWDPATPASFALDPPSFPREITPDDTGGDCDDTKPGVEFIMGGDSHVYVADGSLELCAGPPDAASTTPETTHRIALYGVPALAPGGPPASLPSRPHRGGHLRQLTATIANGPDGLRVAEPSGRKSTTINIPRTTCEVGGTGSDRCHGPASATGPARSRCRTRACRSRPGQRWCGCWRGPPTTRPTPPRPRAPSRSNTTSPTRTPPRG